MNRTALVAVLVTFTVLFWIASVTVHKSVWWAGYDLSNCVGCRAVIDWRHENEKLVVNKSNRRQFQKDGVIVLPSAISVKKVSELSSVADNLSHTFMTDVVANMLLRQYIEYEHRLDTRSEIIRDWAVHGPLGKWAAQLMDVKEVRLYNAEKIYHRGDEGGGECSTAWHRDTVAAPFSPNVRSITFNVYLDDISAENDVLIFKKGSHHDMVNPPVNVEDAFEPRLRVGDILAHDPRMYHTSSGRGCWKRRSLQFRYVESPTIFEFGANRLHGPLPWTLAHSPGVAPHDLKNGDALTGPWYPRVYPVPLEEEHVKLMGSPWKLSSLLEVLKESQEIIAGLGIGNDKNCSIPISSDGKSFEFYGLDGPVTECNGWEMIDGMPLHTNGQMKQKLFQQSN